MLPIRRPHVVSRSKGSDPSSEISFLFRILEVRAGEFSCTVADQVDLRPIVVEFGVFFSSCSARWQAFYVKILPDTACSTSREWHLIWRLETAHLLSSVFPQ